jgi:muconolactone delta-isomerase
VYFHVTGTISDPARLGPFVEDEKRVSLELQDEGSTLIAVRRLDHPGVMLVIEADDREQAEANMARLPFVAEGLMSLDYVQVDRV